LKKKLTLKIALVYELAHYAYTTLELANIFKKPEPTIRGRLSELKKWDLVIKNKKNQWTLTENRKL